MKGEGFSKSFHNYLYLYLRKQRQLLLLWISIFHIAGGFEKALRHTLGTNRPPKLLLYRPASISDKRLGVFIAVPFLNTSPVNTISGAMFPFFMARYVSNCLAKSLFRVQLFCVNAFIDRYSEA